MMMVYSPMCLASHLGVFKYSPLAYFTTHICMFIFICMNLMIFGGIANGADFFCVRGTGE
jgi:hypothetical protein